MKISETNTINGYDLTQVKNTLPRIINCSTKYHEFTNLVEPEQQENFINILIDTLKRVRRYQRTEITDLAKLVRLLYGMQKNDSIQIKYNGKTQLDISYGDTTHLLFNTLNKKLATIYSPKKMLEFYKFLYPELLWDEEIKTPVENGDTKGCIFGYNNSKNYKRIIEFENDDDIDIRFFTGHLFKDSIIPYYAKNSESEPVLPIGFTLKGVKRILAIEATLQKRKDAHYLGALLYTLGNEFQRADFFRKTSTWFTNEQSAFLYDIAVTLGLINEEAAPIHNVKEKQTFVRNEMVKYNKYMKSKKKE